MLLKRIAAGISAAVLFGSLSASETVLFEDHFNSPDAFGRYRCEPGARYSATGGRGNSGCLFFESNSSGHSARVFLKLNPEQIAGKIRLSAWYRGENIGKSAPWFGPKVMLVCKTAHGAAYPEISKRRGTYSWEYGECEIETPPGCRELELVLGIQNCFGKVWIDDVKIERLAPPMKLSYIPYDIRLQKTPLLRGVMSGKHLEEKDFQDLKAWNVNFMRYQMNPGRKTDLSGREAFLQWIDSEIRKIDRLIPRAERNGIRLLLDMHKGPGTDHTSVSSNRLNWNRYDVDTFVLAWEKLARRYKDNPVVFGYDLLNEPAVAKTARNVPGWQEIVERTVQAIRAIDPLKPIIIEPAEGGSPQGFITLRPIQAEHLIYSVHFYHPQEYTHQTDRLKSPIRFQGGKAYIKEKLAPVLAFQKTYRVPILVGEFSASAWAPGAHEYLKLCIEVFEEYGWDWVYHAFRESHWWDVELEGAMDRMVPVSNSLRKQVLLKGFSANETQKTSSGSDGGRSKQRR